MPLFTFYRGGTVLRLSGAAEATFSETGHIGTKTLVSDGGGGGTATWAYAGTYPCRIAPLVSDESMAAARLSDRSTHLIRIPPGTGIEAKHRFLIDGRGTFEVTAVQDRTEEFFTVFEAVEVS